MSTETFTFLMLAQIAIFALTGGFLAFLVWYLGLDLSAAPRQAPTPQERFGEWRRKRRGT